MKTETKMKLTKEELEKKMKDADERRKVRLGIYLRASKSDSCVLKNELPQRRK